jgi:hypothetical protein
MGSRFSSASGCEPKEEASKDDDNATSGKRKRQQEPDNGNDNAAEDPESDEQQQQQQRPLKRLRKLMNIPNALGVVRDSMTVFLAKGFLMAVEVAVQNYKGAGGAGEMKLSDQQDLIPALLQLLDSFQSSNLDILSRGWRLLYILRSSCGNEEQQQQRDDAANAAADTEPESIIKTVVTVMKRHEDSIKVQLLGCRALRTLMNEHHGDNEQNWQALYHAGAIPVFVRAISKFPKELVMQGLGITFVAMLVREEGEPPRLQVLEEGGVALILDAMRRFEDNPHLLHTGCYALHQLGFTRHSREHILRHDGVQVLLRSVQVHGHDVCLVDLCLSALSKLSGQESLQGHEPLPLVLISMEQYPEEQAIQGHCLVLLLRAVGTDATQEQTETAIRLIVKAMRNFQECASVQFFACAVLREILQRSSARHGQVVLNLIMESGGLESVLSAVEKHRDIFGLQPMALLFLMHVWEQCPPHQQEAATAFGGGDNVLALVSGLHMDVDLGEIG